MHNTAKETIDIDEVLASRRHIAHIWCVEDVLQVRPDLNDDQAWEVLQEVRRRLDSDIGISWLTLEVRADDLFPRPETQA